LAHCCNSWKCIFQIAYKHYASVQRESACTFPNLGHVVCLFTFDSCKLKLRFLIGAIFSWVNLFQGYVMTQIFISFCVCLGSYIFLEICPFNLNIIKHYFHLKELQVPLKNCSVISYEKPILSMSDGSSVLSLSQSCR
jgi:hypothetical protein